MIFLGILASIFIFSIIVIIHEYGHYKTARIFWIHVEEFGLWIPPRAKRLWKNKQGTLFSLNWIPLGGFVKISGESEVFFHFFDKNKKSLSGEKLQEYIHVWEDIFDVKWRTVSQTEKKYILAQINSRRPWENFYEKNIIQKTLVLLAGVIMNFILAGVIFSLLFILWVKPAWINTIIKTNLDSKIIPSFESAIQSGLLEKKDWIILSPLPESIADKAWILSGDILLSINEKQIWNITDLQEKIWNSAEKEISLRLQRFSWETYSIKITPNKQGKIGTYLAPNVTIDKDFKYKFWVLESIQHGFYETYVQIRLTISGLRMLGKNIFSPEKPEDREEALNQVSWPIGIVWVITQSLAWWGSLLLILSAIISVNLWVFNLLPIPALDGWRIVLLWIRSFITSVIWKKQSAEKIENMIHIYFFLLLIALSILIAYNDIIKIL